MSEQVSQETNISSNETLGGAEENVQTPTTLPETPERVDLSTLDFQDYIPEEHKGKDYLKPVKSFDDLFNQFDNIQKLIGKRNLPADDATPEQWDEYFSKLPGRPEKPEDYAFEHPEDHPKNEEFDTAVKQLMHQIGLSKQQASILQKGFDGLINQQMQAQATAKKEQDQAFEKLADNLFGDKKDTILSEVKALIDVHAPDDLKPHLGRLDNESLMLLAGVLNSVRNKYIKEDSIHQGPNDSVSMSEQERREEGRKLMLSDAYRDSMHPDHDNVVHKVNILYGTKKP